MTGMLPPTPATRPDRRAEMDASGESIDLRALIGVLLRRKLMIAAITIIGAVAAAAFALQLPTRYSAGTLIMLNTRTMNVVDFESVISNLALRPETIENEITLIRSDAILNRVIDELGLENDPEFNAALREPSDLATLIKQGRSMAFALIPDSLRAALTSSGSEPTPEAIAAARRNGVLSALRENLTVEQLNLSLSIAVRVLSESPARAAQIANAVARIYLLDQLETKTDATESAARWLSERVQAQRANLEASETRLRALTNSIEILDDAGLASRAEQLKTLRERSGIAEAEALDIEARRDEARRLAAASAWREAAALIAEPGAALRAALAQNGGAALATAVQGEIDKLVDLAARRRQTADTLARGVTRLEEEIAAASGARVQLQQLTSDVEASRIVYETLLGRLNETANQFGSLQADGRVLSPAFPPNSPAEPRRGLIVAVGLVLGLLLGCALAFLLEALNTKVRSAREFEIKVGAPVLAHLPQLRRAGRMATTLQRIAASPLALESAQSLRTALLLREGSRPPRVVMVTSSRASEGKSTAALMLARAEAAVGKSVLLIDADLRRPSLHRAFPGLPAGAPDLVAVLSDKAAPEAAIHFDPASGISILPVRRATADATRLVSSEAFGALLAALRGRYESIVIDSPPVMLVSDAFVIGKLADTAVYAVRWNETPRDLAAAGLDKLADHGVPVAGVALTIVDFAMASRYDQIEYGSYMINNPYAPA